jgi:hypothetical protein
MELLYLYWMLKIMNKFCISLFLCIGIAGCKTTESVKSQSVYNTVDSNITKDIGADNTINVPKTWVFKSYPMPMIADIQPVNYRIRSEDLTIAITGFPAKEAKKDNESIKSNVEFAGTPYLNISKEGAANVVLINNPNALGGYASYSCKSDSPCFSVLLGVTTQYVTTVILHGNGNMMYTISIATNSQELQEKAISIIKSIGQ